MSYAAYASPAHDFVIDAPEAERVSYLRKVAGLTLAGLVISAVAGVLSALTIVAVPVLASSGISLAIMLGAYAVAQFGGRALVRAQSAPVQLVGFFVGSAFQGIAMGYLLLAAAIVGAEVFGNPFGLVFQALGLVGLTGVGMLAYVATGPKQLSYVKGMLAIMFLPMMAIMALQVVSIITGWSLFGGFFGTLISFVFVGVSAAGLLVQLNRVIHELGAHQVVEGAYEVTLGLLILFWNVLVLLMRLQRR